MQIIIFEAIITGDKRAQISQLTSFENQLNSVFVSYSGV